MTKKRPEEILNSGSMKDTMTIHSMIAALPDKRRYRFGQSVPSLPSHGICSGSSGGTIDMVDVMAAVAKCNACGARVRIDNL